MDYVLVGLAAVSVLISVITLILVAKRMNGGETDTSDIQRRIDSSLLNMRGELIKSTQDNIITLGKFLKENQTTLHDGMQDSVSHDLNDIKESLAVMNKTLAGGMKESRDEVRAELERQLREIRETVDRTLRELREDNSKKLDEIKNTVDEKLQTELQKRIRESFGTVSDLLERVQKDIGSMRTLADDVGGLKKTLSNVKTRGMMGEFQLESILSEVFSHDQFIKNAHPDAENAAVVEFALKIPTDDGDTILLPIDSKFPRDRYEAVLEAAEGSDKAVLDKAIKDYTTALKNAAKDIHDKYIRPPHTTDFALLFLPTESMYADAVNRDMLPEIWRLYKVYITGPSTISALLSSMQLAFNNMAIQKRAGEVFSILSEVQDEFSKFEEVLQNMQKHLNATNDDLSKLMGVRSRKINSRLGSIRKLSHANDVDMPVLPPVIE